jgi:molybdopterin/thiamine biosynthesis adenylyltransferase
MEQTLASVQIFPGGKIEHNPELQELLKTKEPIVLSSIEEAVEDLFKIDFPYISPGSPEFAHTLADYTQEYWNDVERAQHTRWIYFPWRNTLVELPEESIFTKLRTTRNRHLITEEEQLQFAAARVGIAGMSVGQSAFFSTVLSGGPRTMRIADFDTLSITNLNRLPSSVCELTLPKVDAAARRALELDPYLTIESFGQGISDETLENFLVGNGNEKLDVFVEEIDSIHMKIQSRFAARKHRIPLVMATDNGDNAIIDIERYDLDENYPLFHGSVSEEILANTPTNPTPMQKVHLANAIVGPDVTPRTRFSLTEVSQSIPSWPQLGNAATLSGVAVSYVLRRIITGQSMPSGRYWVNLDAALDPEYNTTEALAFREQDRQEFIESFSLIYETPLD